MLLGATQMCNDVVELGKLRHGFAVPLIYDLERCRVFRLGDHARKVAPHLSMTSHVFLEERSQTLSRPKVSERLLTKLPTALFVNEGGGSEGKEEAP